MRISPLSLLSPSLPSSTLRRTSNERVLSRLTALPGRLQGILPTLLVPPNARMASYGQLSAQVARLRQEVALEEAERLRLEGEQRAQQAAYRAETTERAEFRLRQEQRARHVAAEQRGKLHVALRGQVGRPSHTPARDVHDLAHRTQPLAPQGGTPLALPAPLVPALRERAGFGREELSSVPLLADASLELGRALASERALHLMGAQ